MVSNTVTGDAVLAGPNTQAVGHPFWSALASFVGAIAPYDVSCDDDDTSPECAASQSCEVTSPYATLDALRDAEGTYPQLCTDYYALGALGKTLTTGLANYSVVNQGYDDVFGYYVKYTKNMIPALIGNFMQESNPSKPEGGPGNKYFDCAYQQAGSNIVTTQGCPFNYQGLSDQASYTITYTLRDATGFYNELSTKYAIPQNWVKFGTMETNVVCPPKPQHPNGPPVDPGEGESFCKNHVTKKVNIPLPADGIVVPNPKDTITDALPKVQDLQMTILSSEAQASAGLWGGNADDVLQVGSMPVFMILQAVDSMASAKAIGLQEKADEQRNLIFEVLGLVFMFIPFLDDLAPALEVFSGVVNIIANVGNLVLSVAAIVADPLSAPMEILGFLTGPAGKDEKAFKNLGDARRGMGDQVLTDVGKVFKAKDDEFKNIVKSKCLR